jgi:hypothetical protein
MKDEFKAMHALWGRWIVLNRNEFIADFFYNMCMFVDSYWRMIHRACGFGAFRYWALVRIPENLCLHTSLLSCR